LYHLYPEGNKGGPLEFEEKGGAASKVLLVQNSVGTKRGQKWEPSVFLMRNWLKKMQPSQRRDVPLVRRKGTYKCQSGNKKEAGRGTMKRSKGKEGQLARYQVLRFQKTEPSYGGVERRTKDGKGC